MSNPKMEFRIDHLWDNFVDLHLLLNLQLEKTVIFIYNFRLEYSNYRL